MSTDFGARLKAARKHAGLTQQQLAKAVGMGQSTLAQLEREGFGSSFVVALAKSCGVSAQWLASGDGPMVVVNVDTAPTMRGRVPLISWVQAGQWCDAADPFQPGDAEDWLYCPISHSEGTFALVVRGDSMTAPHGNSRTYPEGCIIFVDPDRRSPVNGDRVVACLEDSHEVTFKIYKNEDGRQWLQPLNPSHEPIRQPFKVLGTVIGKWERD